MTQSSPEKVHLALPAMVVAIMCVKAELVRGAVSPDNLELNKFFKGMADRHESIKFDEKNQTCGDKNDK